MTPHEYALSRGWGWAEIEATARLGVAEDDQGGVALGRPEPDDLLAWCRERVAAEQAVREVAS